MQLRFEHLWGRYWDSYLAGGFKFKTNKMADFCCFLASITENNNVLYAKEDIILKILNIILYELVFCGFFEKK